MVSPSDITVDRRSDTAGPAPEVDPAAFVASVVERFDAAADRVGAVDVDLRIAGRIVRLSFAGDALVARLTPAFRHVTLPEPGGRGLAPAAVPAGASGLAGTIATDPIGATARATDASGPTPATGPATTVPARATEPEPDIVLRVWDSRSTGTPLPPPPWSWDRYCTRGDIDGYNTATVRTAYAGSLNVFDAATGAACWWVPDAEAIGDHEPGAPLRILLHWWLEARGLQLVHGAAVGPPSGGGVLLAGAGGAGKSSTALTCLRASWSYVADDYCAVDTTAAPVAHTLYATGKADGESRARMGGFAVTDEVPVADRGKSILFLSPDHDDRLVASLPIDAILLPHVVDRTETRLRPASALETTRALADSTLRQLPAAGDHAWHTLAALARSVPACHLDLGRDTGAIPDAIATALHDRKPHA